MPRIQKITPSWGVTRCRGGDEPLISIFAKARIEPVLLRCGALPTGGMLTVMFGLEE